MKLLFICQSVDEKDSITADTLGRIKEFAAHPEIDSVSVVCLYAGTQSDFQNTKIYPISRKGQFKIITLINFYRTIISILRSSKPRPVAYFYMTPGLLPVFLPIKLLGRVKTVIWFCHTQCSTISRFGIRFCADKWVTTNRSLVANGIGNKTPSFAGQGVDVSSFRPSKAQIDWDIITVGRITPCKKIHEMIEVLKICEESFGAKYSLAVCGDIYTEKDRAYKEEAVQIAKSYGLAKRVHFIGTVDHSDLNTYLNKAKIFLFLVKGGIGKASVEAMAAGLPAIISSPDADDFFPRELAEILLCEPESSIVAHRVNELLTMPEIEFETLKQKVRSHMEIHCSRNKFVDRVVSIIKE